MFDHSKGMKMINRIASGKNTSLSISEISDIIKLENDIEN